MTDYNDFMKQAFEEGLMSDVRIQAFNKTYRLHRLQLSRSPFFQSLFHPNGQTVSIPGAFLENEYVLTFTNQPLITQESFELALRRFYNCEDLDAESKIPVHMFVTANFFKILPCEDDAFDYLVKEMTNDQALLITKNFYNREYGEFRYGGLGSRLLASAKLKLRVFGWSDGAKKWDEVPGSTIVQVVSNAKFEVPNEYQRARFVLDLLKRRWAMKPKSKTTDEDKDLLKGDIKTMEKYMEWLYQTSLSVDEKSYFGGYRRKNGTWGPKSNFLYSLILTIFIMVGMLLLYLFIFSVACFILLCMVLFLKDNWECLIGAILFTPMYRVITCKTKNRSRKKSKKIEMEQEIESDIYSSYHYYPGSQNYN